MLVSTRSWPGMSEAWQWSMGVGQGKGQEKSQRPWNMTEAFLGVLRICTLGDSWGAAEDNGIPLLVEVLLTDLGRYNLYIMKFTPVKCLTWWL